ncbi:fungal-specific transcription factor domain-containing protein [Armillaria borealis]|uniref:Fungal-specific transcription factor domain-containing protein n=1 Tax=Armillaria borealis TaxID=47425 RepID=A0AA39K101_9AGAR|nr:fungal-specific transcription factor domain-containing protein [Armillaria borealis]
MDYTTSILFRTSSSAPASSNVSPSLYPVSMAPAPEDRESPSLSGSSRGTPTYNTVDLPRTPSASKGGCWTCRLRRKKCDEQREGDSCRTCVRLTIECLGWGPRRPEWMRDKQAVEAYKANIKAKLTRAGLIRGQPRTSMLQAHAAKPAPTTASSSLALDVDLRPFDYRYDPPRMGGMPGIPGPSNGFHQLPAASYSDSNVNSMDFGAPMYQYSPQSSSVHSEPLDFDMGLYIAQHNNDQFDFNIRPPSPIQSFPLLAGQNSIQESHVMYFFEHVRKTNLPFSSNALTNLTYTMIVQEPRGAVTNAVCALSSLHFTRMRVAQGLEAPDPNPEHSTAQYFHDEAKFQLASGTQAKSRYAESDVLAALYLLCFSQMAGSTVDWPPMLAIALEWISQTGLPTGENPKLVLANMSTSSQLIMKCTMWMDIFASFTLMKQPKYLALYKCLLGDQNGFWGRGLHMENLTGCPDEAMLALAEISGLAHWKTSEQAKGSLSFRELVRRGDDIEQRLRNRQREPSNFGEQTPLHPNLMQTAMSDAGAISYPDEVMQLVGNLFRESALLYLHTIINEDNPAVPEITASVNTITQLLHQLAPSEIDRTLVFPVCLAGCMTDNSSHRDFLKSRLQSQDESIGNLLRTRLVMEAVWQKRDTRGGPSEWIETLRERCPNLLLI